MFSSMMRVIIDLIFAVFLFAFFPGMLRDDSTLTHKKEILS